MRLLHCTITLAILGMPGAALAQRAQENAVANADDAFGSSVGLESTGIYSEQDTRGFNPSKAGNARIDGVYYDPVGSLSSRLRMGSVIRVGFAAEEYPFPAPTGIIEYRLRPVPKELGISPAYNFMAFGGFIREFDLRAPLVKDKLFLVGGAAQSDLNQSDGGRNEAWGITTRFIARLGDVEFAPFAAVSWFTANHVRPLTVVTGDTLPTLPKVRRYLGQEWAVGRNDNHTFGGVLKAAVSPRLSLRAGLFHGKADRQENYSEIFNLVPAGAGVVPTLANHLVISDPSQAVHSTSGEVQVALRLGGPRWQHRVIAGIRARNRLTQTGGSFVRNYSDPLTGGAPVPYGLPDPRPEPTFAFTTPNDGRVKQQSVMLGYIAKIPGTATINLGLQKARYRGTSRDGRTGIVTRSDDDPWLYNASLGFELTPTLSIFGGTQKGLEDSGTAPENALNRNEQLPATRSVQYEAGARWKFHGGQLAVNAFQITKPYFSFDQTRNFTQVGTLRLRGVEASLSGHFGKRLNMVAGAVATQPRVINRLPSVGERPAGMPSLFAKIDVNYRTDIFGGLTPTATLSHTGARAVSAGPLTSLGGRQLMVPGYTTLDLGLRQSFKLGSTPMSFRMLVWNVTDAATWKVVAANTLLMEERRRFNMTVTADF
jgi:iron complex outermembrane recepter protein